jgi:hypothetical protein
VSTGSGDHHLCEGRATADDRRERVVEDRHVAGVLVSCGRVGEAEPPEEVGDAARGAGSSRVG